MSTPFTRLRRHFGRGGFALADQVIVGGMNFLTMILVGRVAGAHQLGLFALGLSIVYLLLAVQESIITTPATIVSPRLSEDERRRYFGASLTLQAALSLIICAVLLLAACATWLVTNEAESAIGLAVLALAAPMWCLREFCRRLAFAQLNARSVLALDVCAALLLGGGLAGLIVTGHFTAATAFAAVGLATGVSAVCWLMLRRRHFELHVREIGSALRENLVVGKWILSGQATSIATAEAMPWIIAGMLGTEATGVFAACRSVFRVANPLVVTVSNLITPYAAHAYAAGGRPQVHAIVRSAMLGMGALMTAFLLVLAVIGGDLLGLLFGPQYAQHYWVLLILAAAQLVLLVRMGPARGLLVIDRPQLGVAAEVLGCTVLLASVVPMIAAWDLYGAAGCFLLATTLGTLLYVAFYYYVSMRGEAQATAPNVPLRPSEAPESTSAECRPAASACLEAVE